ncbi:MAG: prepilin-type N-terminal cleavage/methylation domain-containing protein [Thermodesulfobacteriota bacterium]
MFSRCHDSAAIRLRGVSGEAGFTLLEIMVALAILGGVIVTVLASVSYHLSVMDSNLDKTLASMLAIEKLEQIRLLGEGNEKEGLFGPEYEGFSWNFTSEKSGYSGIENESLTVSRGGAGITMETMASGE